MENDYIRKECGDSGKTGLLRTKGLILTYQCNLDCSYCYIPVKSTRVMPLPIAKEAVRAAFDIKNAVEYDRVEIQFMGGEPLIAFQRLQEIAEWIWSQKWDKPYILFATTNGTMLDADRKRWFFENRNRFILCLSYDGTDRSQDVNRSESSRDIDLEFFLKTWPSQPIKMTISQQTVKDLAKGVISLSEAGFRINANVAYEYEKWSIENIREYANQMSQMIDYYVKNPGGDRVSILSMNIVNLLKSQSMAQHKYCGAGGAFDVTDIDGKQYPCHMFSPLVLIKSRLKHLNDIDFNEQKNFADKRCSKCCLKNICPTCAGMNYDITGNTELRDETHCRIFIIDVMSNVKLQARLLKSRREAGVGLTKEECEVAQAAKYISNILDKNFRRV